MLSHSPLNVNMLMTLLIVFASTSHSYGIENGTLVIPTVSTSSGNDSITSSDDPFPFTTASPAMSIPTPQFIHPLGRWQFHIGRWTEYDPENLTSFVDGLVTLQTAFCPEAPMCGNSSAFRGERRCLIGHMCEDCECDPECVEYGDCCPDTIHRYGLPKSGAEFKCVDQNIKDISQTKRASFKMITECPLQFTDHKLKSKCEERSTVDDIMYPPVTLVTYRRTYRNEFCAKCHGIISYVPWTLEIECYASVDIYFLETIEDFLQELANSPVCSLYNEAPSGVRLRQCFFFGTVDRCNVTGNWKTYDPFLEKACSTYTAIVQDGGPNYRNTFCFLCNGFPPLGSQRSCWLAAGEFLVSLAALLNFQRQQQSGKNNADIACRSNEMYDISKEICRNVSCPLGMHDVNGTCAPFMEIITGARYRFSTTLIPIEGDIRILNDTSVWMSIVLPIKHNLPNWSFRHSIEVGSYCSYLKLRYDSDETCLPGERRIFLNKLILIIDIKVTREHANRMELENSLREVFETPWILTVAKIKYCFRPIMATEAVETDLIMDGVLKNDNTLQHCVDCENQLYGMCFRFPAHAGPKPMRISELLYCRQVELLEDEYIASENTTYLQIIHLNRTIDAYHYNIAKSGKARICLDYYVNITKGVVSNGTITSPSSVIEGYLSLVCTCLSMVCLVCTLMTYCIFSTLRTRPGVNNIILAITLFLAQGFFQFGAGHIEFFWFCRIMGMLIHYLWLSTFCWLNICSYHMYKSFSDAFNVRSSLSTGRMIARYCAYGFFMPAVLVALTVGCHAALFGPSEIGYGGTICYLSSRLARGLAFALPLGLIIISNIVFFAITMRSIRNTPTVASTAERTHHAIVYVKLSSLTGMTWVFGYAAEISLFQPLFYIFIVLGGCQGVFIFISYICTRRVARLYTNLVKKERSSTFLKSKATKSSIYSVTEA